MSGLEQENYSTETESIIIRERSATDSMADRESRRMAREKAGESLAGATPRTRRAKKLAEEEQEALVMEESKYSSGEEEEVEKDDENNNDDDNDAQSDVEYDGGNQDEGLSSGDSEDELPKDEFDDDEIEGENATSKDAGRENGAFFAKTLMDLVDKSHSHSDDEEDDDDKDDDEDSENSEAESGEETTVLTKRKTKEMKENEKLRREARARKRARKAKREQRERGIEDPATADFTFERQLRKIATKGVVMLFNTIQTHQAKKRQQQSEANKEAEKVKAASKDSFLDMLKQGSKADPAGGVSESEMEDNDDPAAAKSGWGAMRDDYMLGAKLKDYGKGNEEEMEDDEGAELESVSD